MAITVTSAMLTNAACKIRVVLVAEGKEMMPAAKYWCYLSVNCIALQSLHPRRPNSTEKSYICINRDYDKEAWHIITVCRSILYVHFFLDWTSGLGYHTQRPNQICMWVINGSAFQQYARWWPHFHLRYSSDSGLTSAKCDLTFCILWIVCVKRKYKHVSSNSLFI